MAHASMHTTPVIAGSPDRPEASRPNCSRRSSMPYSANLRELIVDPSPISISWIIAMNSVRDVPPMTTRLRMTPSEPYTRSSRSAGMAAWNSPPTWKARAAVPTIAPSAISEAMM